MCARDPRLAAAVAAPVVDEDHLEGAVRRPLEHREETRTEGVEVLRFVEDGQDDGQPGPRHDLPPLPLVRPNDKPVGAAASYGFC
jgi:hypothetical protein